jgi:hypothetical protein
MAKNPQHGCPLLFIQCIFWFNEQKAPILFMLVQLPEVLHRMNAAFNTCFQTSTKLVDPTASLASLPATKRRSFASDCGQIS